MGRPVGGVGVDAVADAVAASAHPLLVAVDVDGTLSPLVRRSDQAVLVAGASDVLAVLASAGVAVAVVSGRGLADLQRQFAWPANLRLVGSHGLEDSATPDFVPTAEERQRLQALSTLAHRTAKAVQGTWVETKVAGVAYHYREATPASAGSIAAHRLGEQLSRMEGVWLRRGHLVLEAAVRPGSKPDAVGRLRHEAGAATVVFLGDDETDEEVFRLLAPPHISVRVGPGETAARYGLADPDEVVEVLRRIATLNPSPR